MNLNFSLYVITDKKLARGFSLLEIAREAIAGGATALQLRCKGESFQEAFALGRELRELTRQTNTLFIINDQLDLALYLDADGVHLGQEDLPAAEARRLLPEKMFLGVSAATVAEAKQAEQDGADYLGAGPVYATSTKPDAGLAIGLEQLTAVCRSVRIPVVGIGGITAAKAGEVLQAGAAGLAVISAIIAAKDPRAEANLFIQEIERAGRQG